MTRLSLLLATSCLGTGAALVGGRALLEKLPPLTPATPSSQLERLRRWAPDPNLRREASLLLAQRFPDDPRLQRDLLGGLGWGTDPVAAVALKNAAQKASALGEHDRARQLWKTLLQRLPSTPSVAGSLPFGPI